jgi:hypothetical protein
MNLAKKNYMTEIYGGNGGINLPFLTSAQDGIGQLHVLATLLPVAIR